jgi:hypothetical protein
MLNLILKLQNCRSTGKGTSYIQWKEGRVTGFSTSGVETEFCITILKIERMGRGERRCKQLLHDHTKIRRYWELKEEAPDRNFFRNCCSEQSRRVALKPGRKSCFFYINSETVRNLNVAAIKIYLEGSCFESRPGHLLYFPSIRAYH